METGPFQLLAAVLGVLLEAWRGGQGDLEPACLERGAGGSSMCVVRDGTELFKGTNLGKFQKPRMNTVIVLMPNPFSFGSLPVYFMD